MNVELMKSLSILMGLQVNDLPSIEINQKSAPRRLIGQLVQQNYIPSYQTAPDDLKWLVEGEGDCQPDTSIHIIDLLGVYDSGKNKIILYDLLIKLCSLQLNLDHEGLKTIVMIHELSHAITHRGIDSDKKIWEYFDIAAPDTTEYFAQIYTYKKLLRDNNKLCLKIMDRLSETQSGVYQSYKESIAKPIDAINEELYKARRMIPVGFELYPEAIGYAWSVVFDNMEKYEEIDNVVYMMMDCRPRPLKRKTIKSGTYFCIKANLIKIKSYDYQPSSDKFSVKSTMCVHSLISNNKDQIKGLSISSKTQKPLFCIQVDGGEYYLDLTDTTFVRNLWSELLAIINNEYPVLGKVLKGYENGFS